MKKKFTLSFFFLLLGEIVYNASAYIVVSFLGRILGPADYGRYALVVGFVTMITVLISRGIPTAMSKRISEKPDDFEHIYAVRKQAIQLQFPIIIILSVVFFLSSPLIARVLGDESLTPLFRIASFIIPCFALSSFYVLYLNGLKSYKALAIIKGLRGIIRIFGILGFAYFFALEGALIGASFSPLALFFIALVLSTFIDPTIKSLRLITEKVRTKKITLTEYPKKNILSYAGGFMLFLFCYELYTRVDLFLIKIILQSDAMAGIYDAALKIILIPLFGIYALTLMLFPTFSELGKKLTSTKKSVKRKAEKDIRILLKNLTLLAIALLPIGAIGIYVLKDFIVSLLFGEEFLFAGELIPHMLSASVFAAVFYILASILNGAGKTKITATIVAMGLIVSIALNSLYMPLYGVFATATIFSFTSTLMALAAIIATYTLLYKKDSRK